MKTIDEDSKNDCKQAVKKFKNEPAKIVYADFKNAPGTNLTSFSEEDNCCTCISDKPANKSPEKYPDFDFIADNVRKIIISCNDDMKMLTTRPVSSKVAPDVEGLCYCEDPKFPGGPLPGRFQGTVQKETCPTCLNLERGPKGFRATLDKANITGPCGKVDCKVARDLRAYIEDLVEEDNNEIDVNALVGPCGSESCTGAKTIQEFIRHDGNFTCENSHEDIPTQCDCMKQVQALAVAEPYCAFGSKCSEEGSIVADDCKGIKETQTVNMFYCTADHELKENPQSASTEYTFKHCSNDCPSIQAPGVPSCSKATCSTEDKLIMNQRYSPCGMICPGKRENSPSPADSDIMMRFENIQNPCCVKSCDIAETVKDFIAASKKTAQDDDPCYCDCACTFKFTNKTTYCAVCGGYECLGEDMKNQPAYAKPHPCPIYHKLYDKK